MKITLDENVTTSARTPLAQRGHGVDTVADEGLTGGGDSVVVEPTRRTSGCW